MTLLLHVQIVRCPSTGRILLTGETDDKALCDCPSGLHKVRGLRRATLRAFVEQERSRARRVAT